MSFRSLLRMEALAFGAASALIVSLLVAAPVRAEPMVFVDMQRLIDESIVGKAAKADVEAEARKRQSELLTQQRELERAQNDLGKQKGVLSPAAFEERAEALQKRQRDFERSAQDFQEELTRKSQAAVARVVKDIQTVVEEYSSSHGFGLVIERDQRSVLYVRPEFDISEQIVTILNEKKLAS
jgi:outer membrane protein